MIPILYESTETTFTSNGIGRLSDAVSCTVTEERNGPYELEMEYPTTGIHYSDIQLFRIIFAVPADGKTGQPFEIYEISKPLNGIVTIRAWHLSYRLNKIVVKPFTAASCSAALTGLVTNSTTTNPFTFSTDKSVSATFTVKTPTECRGLLGGQAGSILDVYGKGDYEFDKFSVYLRTNRGADNGVTIRYGKNLTDLDAEAGMDNVYTGIVPYYYNEETGELVTVTGYVLWDTHRSDYPFDMVRPVDLSYKWDEAAPTSAQLQTAAESYLSSNPGWELSTNLKVEFVALADTEEYKETSALQRVNLCDTVTIIHEGLGISSTAKVVKTEYDVLLERYNSIELGTASVSLGQAIEDSLVGSGEVPTTSAMQRAIANGTALITGNNGGYVVLKKNANGKPEELLILGPESGGDIDQAVNVWRFNNAGLGFSPNGYDGPYNAAWTYDGKFYVDWVTAGAINAALVNTGTITSSDGSVSIVLCEKDSQGQITNAGQIIINASNFKVKQNGDVEMTGKVTATSGKIGGSNGLTILNSKGFYSGNKSTLMSGNPGIYVGTDGVSIGNNGNFRPAMWCDYADEKIRVAALDFVTTPDSSPYWGNGHSLLLDDQKRIFSGAGCNFGSNGAYNPPGGEYDSCIYNTLYASVSPFSDRRIKHDIEELSLDDSRRFIMGLRPVSFQYDSDIDIEETVHHGMIAQEVDGIVQDDWGVVTGKSGSTLGLRYTEMIADMIKVIQDQQHRIEALEAALKEKE